MTETENPSSQRNKDTKAATLSSRATYAKRRHAKWIAELEAAGVKVEIPESYTGLPLDQEQ